MIARFLRRFQRKADPWRGEVDVLAEELARPPEERDVGTVFPVILPYACLNEDWPGPIVPLGRLAFAVAWATVPEPNRFIYVTHEQAAYWLERGLDWRGEAMRNLARVSVGRWWGDKSDDAGKPFVLALLPDDALGPSRLLLPHLFDDVLGPGYQVAIPEQTCAIAYRAKLDLDQKLDVDAMIEGCFRHGTEPISNERFDPAEFWVPLDGGTTKAGG
jgi:hypothetical protein